MARFIDESGNIYGKWKVIDYVGHSKWRCQCECGNISIVTGATLRNGTSTNCGCLRIKHGMEGTHIYRLWAHMKERCDNPNYKSYRDYGGRGISYQIEWKEFIPFMEWAIKNGYSEMLTLDRIDVNGDYTSDNCRFINNIMQQRNKRNSRFITINGERRTVSEWAEISNLNRHTILYRLNKGETGIELLRAGRKGGGIRGG